MKTAGILYSVLMTGVIFLSAIQAEVPVLLEAPSGGSIIDPEAEPVKNPAMKWAQGTFAKDPSVVRFNGKYYLYYSFFMKGAENQVLTIGIAESTDLTNWNFVKNIYPMQECDAKGLGAPCAKVMRGKVWLFYQTYGTGTKDAICCAWSDDGLNFTPHPENPVFRPSGNWTNGRAIDAEVAEFNGRLFLYAATRDPEGKIQKLTAASTELTSDFSPKTWQQEADFSILEPVLPWETCCVEAPTTVVRNGKIYLFYAGGYNNDPQHIGAAQSSDGVHFTRLWNIPFLSNGPEGQWNESESGHPGLFTDEDGTCWLFYQGNATHGKDWYLSRVKLEWDDADEKISIPRLAENQ